MIKRVCAIQKIVSQKQEDACTGWLAQEHFAEAYAELRRKCPVGNLRIHLSIEETDEPAADKRVFRTGQRPAAGK